MNINIISCIATVLLFCSCSQKPSIEVLCEKDTQGNYILKWEIYPEKDNIPVEIYVSDDDSNFPPTPFAIANSNDYIKVIGKLSGEANDRKFFKLKIQNAYSEVVTNRFFSFDSIQNFRDIGGYRTNDNHHIKWGKLFRSGNFSRMTKHDSIKLNKLGIRTILDMRSEDVKHHNLACYASANTFRIPIANNGYNAISKKIMDGHFLKGDAVIYTQDIYKTIIENYTEGYANFFDYLCDEKNYPIVFHCYLGKDQTGLATYFLLKALDIPLDIIEDDYMASETGIDRTKIVKNADTLSESRQEALTMLTKTDLSYLKYGISCIREKSGSVEAYMAKELRITPEKKKKLKEILLQ